MVSLLLFFFFLFFFFFFNIPTSRVHYTCNIHKFSWLSNFFLSSSHVLNSYVIIIIMHKGQSIVSAGKIYSNVKHTRPLRKHHIQKSTKMQNTFCQLQSRIERGKKHTWHIQYTFKHRHGKMKKNKNKKTNTIMQELCISTLKPFCESYKCITENQHYIQSSQSLEYMPQDYKSNASTRGRQKMPQLLDHTQVNRMIQTPEKRVWTWWVVPSVVIQITHGETSPIQTVLFFRVRKLYEKELPWRESGGGGGGGG